jgi:hypothetical protein
MDWTGPDRVVGGGGGGGGVVGVVGEVVEVRREGRPCLRWCCSRVSPTHRHAEKVRSRVLLNPNQPPTLFLLPKQWHGAAVKPGIIMNVSRVMTATMD